MKFSIVLSFLALALPFVTGNPLRGSHHEVARRARGEVDPHKRSFDNARFTFYDVGLGACGIWNKPSDHIVAMSHIDFGAGYPGPHCLRPITILCNGVNVSATVTDKCMGCPSRGLDCSRGLFDICAPESDGVFYGSWWFDEDE